MAQLRIEVPDAAVVVLSRRAHEAGTTLGEYLRHELERLSLEPARPTGAGTARVDLLEALDGANEAEIDRAAVAEELRDTLRMLTFERGQPPATRPGAAGA